MKSKTIFVDVDTQWDFMDPEGALSIPEGKSIIPALKRLTSFAEERGLPLLATMDTHTPDDNEFSHFPLHCVKDTEGWKKIEATSSTRTEIFLKTTFDIFTNPAFAQRVVDLAPQRAVVYGVATDYCVKAAALGLASMVPEIMVVHDAIRPVTEEGGRSALAEITGAGCKLVSTAEVETLLDEEFKTGQKE